MSKASDLLLVLDEAKKVIVYEKDGSYIVIIGKDAYEMSGNPTPSGVNMYAGDVGIDIKVGSHLGKKVKVNALPKEVQKAIKDRENED